VITLRFGIREGRCGNQVDDDAFLTPRPCWRIGRRLAFHATGITVLGFETC